MPLEKLERLRIEGRIVALGTAENRIVFTSAEKSKSVRDWSYIHLLGSQAENQFEYCRFEYGFSGYRCTIPACGLRTANS